MPTDSLEPFALHNENYFYTVCLPMFCVNVHTYKHNYLFYVTALCFPSIIIFKNRAESRKLQFLITFPIRPCTSLFQWILFVFNYYCLFPEKSIKYYKYFFRTKYFNFLVFELSLCKTIISTASGGGCVCMCMCVYTHL